MDWKEVVTPILGGLAGILGTWIGLRFVALLNRLTRNADENHFQAAVRQAVKWAAQKLQDSVGKEKFAEVSQHLHEKFPWVPADELEKAIEAALIEFNRGMK